MNPEELQCCTLQFAKPSHLNDKKVDVGRGGMEGLADESCCIETCQRVGHDRSPNPLPN